MRHLSSSQKSCCFFLPLLSCFSNELVFTVNSFCRARVFVGNMNTNIITRDDIIQLFGTCGTLLGVTLFKGYAFIQYSNCSEADFAVSTLNGYVCNGSILGWQFNFLKLHRIGFSRRVYQKYFLSCVKAG